MSSNGKQHPARNDHHFAVLTKEFRVQVLNCSSSGCLFEARSRMEIGTIASLRLLWEGEEFVEELRVVRCRQIEGAGSLYHVGAEFLWTDPPGSRSLRRAMRGVSQPLSLDTSSSTFPM
jgi:PilZ domain